MSNVKATSPRCAQWSALATKIKKITASLCGHNIDRITSHFIRLFELSHLWLLDGMLRKTVPEKTCDQSIWNDGVEGLLLWPAVLIIGHCLIHQKPQCITLNVVLCSIASRLPSPFKTRNIRHFEIMHACMPGPTVPCRLSAVNCSVK